MAEQLKHQFGPTIPAKIAAMVSPVWPSFASESFIQDVLDGYEPLSLTERGWKIAHALRRYLPDDVAGALEVLAASLGPALERTDDNGMAPFLYLPHVFFVAAYGLDHFELSMQAQYELTQRFSAEFSIRPFLERYPEETLTRLKLWTADPSVHVRRLVSEGTRPRLPWAPRLRSFQADPTPVLELLELLKDDPELYVRRSVANNLNDIGKDHPDLLVETARKWLDGASPERQWLVRHALRSAVKRADPGALALLGYGKAALVSVSQSKITPTRPRLGESVTIALEIENRSPQDQRVLVDLQVHFRKANGKTSPKVFKIKALDLAPNETARVSKKISLADLTTRRHYPGPHPVYVQMNGQAEYLGTFDLDENGI